MEYAKTFFGIIKRFEFQITFSYLLIGFLWIFLSDSLFGYMITDKHLLTEFSIVKGFFYMLTTAFLLFFFVKRQMGKLKKAIEKAEESNRLKSAFLANMSHEIRTPMNGILGFADLLKEPGLTGEEQQEYIKIIEKSGKRMLNIINDLVDISKIESGLMQPELQNVNLNEQLDAIYCFFKPEAEIKGLKLVCSKKLSVDEAIIVTDREKSFSILSNLIKNALKYSNEGVVEYGCERNGEVLTFFVKDTGIGIHKERQEAVFERFVQADIADKMARQGAGLGLSISKAYVEMLGGKIWLDSKEGVGSTFSYTLPFNSCCVHEKDADSEILNVKEKMTLEHRLKILIADDDEVSDRLVEKGVDIFSREILKARNGVEAVELCRINPDIDLIMMDIQMPVMNGIEAIRKIRQFNKEVVIIAQTAYALSGDRETALEAGCDDYISKPIMKFRLQDLIRKNILNQGTKAKAFE